MCKHLPIRKTVAEVVSTWCIKNHTCALFPVGGRSDKTVRSKKISIFGEVLSIFRHRCLCLF